MPLRDLCVSLRADRAETVSQSTLKVKGQSVFNQNVDVSFPLWLGLLFLGVWCKPRHLHPLCLAEKSRS